jgi:hypothetical protein
MTRDTRPLPEVSGFVVGHRERLHLGRGWWDRQEGLGRPGFTYRTACPCAEFRLWGRRGQSQLRLLLAASTTLIGGPAELEVLCAQEGAEPGSLGVIQIPWEEWAVRSLPCSVEGSGPLTFVLQTHTVAVPHAVLRNGDHRELGVHLAAAHLC